MARAVVIALELVDGAVDGGWCRSCLLSTGMTVTIMVTTGGRSTLSSFRRCHECGGDQIDPAGD